MSKLLKFLVSVALATMLLVSAAGPALAAPSLQLTACWNNCIVE